MAKSNIISSYRKGDKTYILVDLDNELNGMIVIIKNCQNSFSTLYVSSKTYSEEKGVYNNKAIAIKQREGEERVIGGEEEEDFKIHPDAKKILEKMKGENGEIDKWPSNFVNSKLSTPYASLNFFLMCSVN